MSEVQFVARRVAEVHCEGELRLSDNNSTVTALKPNEAYANICHVNRRLVALL